MLKLFAILGMAAMPFAAMAASPDEATVRALIARGYGSFQTERLADNFSHFATPALHKAWERDVEEEGLLDADPFCSCQDYEPTKFRFRILTLRMAAKRAVADVDVDVGLVPRNGQSAWRTHQLTFIKTQRGWLVDGVKSNWTGRPAR